MTQWCFISWTKDKLGTLHVNSNINKLRVLRSKYTNQYQRVSKIAQMPNFRLSEKQRQDILNTLKYAYGKALNEEAPKHILEEIAKEQQWLEVHEK
jgi:hypothetical protein